LQTDSKIYQIFLYQFFQLILASKWKWKFYFMWFTNFISDWCFISKTI